MKSFLPLLSLLLPLVLQAQAQDQCPDGFTAVEIPPGSGNWTCQKLEVVCPGINRDFIDQATGQARCCPTANQLVILDPATKKGVCCKPDEKVLGDKCVSPDIPDNGGGGPDGPGDSTGCRGQCPHQPRGACSLKAACGDATNNGLNYGSCYNLVLPDGRQLGRAKHGHNKQYVPDGHVQDIPFKVCKSTTDCGSGIVGNSDTFFLQDTIGGLNDETGRPGWVDNAEGGKHLEITHKENDAGKFKGKNACSANCKCVIKLSGDPNGIGYACPSDRPGLTFWPNSRVTLNMQFVEVPCDGNFNQPPFQG